MIPLSIITNIDEGPWDREISTLGTITRVGRLPHGTASGKSTVTIVITQEDGTKTQGQTTLSLFLSAASALKAAAEQAGEISP